MLARARNVIELTGKLAYFKTKEGGNTPSLKLDSRAKKALKQLKKVGYAILPGYYTPKQCDELRAEIDRIENEYKGQYYVESEGTDIRIYDSNKVSEKIEAFRTDPYLKKIGDNYLGVVSKVIHTLAGKLTPQKAAETIINYRRWHRDNSFIHQFKAMIYLNDVKEENGAFWYFPDTHKTNNLYREVLKYRKPNKIGVDYDFSVEDIKRIAKIEKRGPKPLEAKKGSVVLFDSRGIHRGPPIKKGARYTLTNYYMQPKLLESPNIQKFWNKMYRIKGKA